MTIRFTGSGAAGGVRLQPHDDTLFGGALAHWTFNNTLVEAVTGGAGYDASKDSGTAMYMQTAAQDGDLNRGYVMGDDVVTDVDSANTALRVQGALSGAIWVHPYYAAGTNCAVFGFREPGGSGDPNTHNFPWEIGWNNATSKFRWLHQHGNKLANTVDWSTSTGFGSWQWIGFTRPTAATSVRLFYNGAFDVEGTGFTAPNGGTGLTKVTFMGNNDTVYFRGAIFSAILFDSELSDANMATLFNSTFA